MTHHKPSESKPELYALLIGIDFYQSGRVNGRVYYHNLSGSVNGTKRIESYLKRMFGKKKCDIRRLLSPPLGIGSGDYQSPTYENIIKEMKRLTEDADPGKLVLVYFAGHGGRATTKYPDVKGAEEHCYDEALVPMDIGHTEDRYLRDLELAQLISDMVDKKLMLTLIIDSCHSGGTTRAAGTLVPRGIGVVDRTPRNDLCLVAEPEKLQETWNRLLRESTRKVVKRHLGSATGWLPEPNNYVLLAACRENERAWEKSHDGLPVIGIFTHWLVDSLERIGSMSTYQRLYERVRAKVHTDLLSQTPQLEGERYRYVFGDDSDRSIKEYFHGINVLEVDREGGRVQLNTGAVHAVGTQAQLAVYQPMASIEYGKPEAYVEVTETGVTESWAKITSQLGGRGVRVGDQALLLRPGPLRLVRRVQLLDEPTDKGRSRDHELVRQAFQRVDPGFVRLAAESENVDMQVAITDDRQLEIRDAGGVRLPNLASLPLDPDGAETLVKRLDHLARYRNIQELDNPDATSSIQSMLHVELYEWPRKHSNNKLPTKEQLENRASSDGIPSKSKLCLWITNMSSEALNVGIIDLQPDWGVTLLREETLSPGQGKATQLEAYLPPGYERGTDHLKIIGTIGYTRYEWIELLAIGEPVCHKRSFRPANNAFEELQMALAVSSPRSSTIAPVYRSTNRIEWVVAEIEVSIVDKKVYEEEQRVVEEAALKQGNCTLMNEELK